ncbi:MAG: hypothetical protein HKP54_04990 [Boseongicola sp.]|nr:hypothetical protein [Boseongicola sp.]
MTGSNKILTVSYGTFSCTLEGFDDPFGTMRGIAEYFRDLAADDRYFGAEPPTPDVEMLQNIAQKEVQRRVEAHVGDTGLALRQVDEDVKDAAPETSKPETPTAPEPVAEADNAEDAEVLDSGPLAFDDDYLMADEPEDVLTVDTSAAPAATDHPAESVAEKLRRIRAVVSRTIEPEEDPSAFEDAPESEAGAETEEPQLRQRALSKTIAAITADLADEDDVTDTDVSDTIDADDVEAEAPLTLSDDAAEKADTSLIASIVASDRDFDTGEETAENLFDDEDDTDPQNEGVADVEDQIIAQDDTTEDDFEDDSNDLEEPDQIPADTNAEESDENEDDFEATLNAAIANVASKVGNTQNTDETDDDAAEEVENQQEPTAFAESDDDAEFQDDDFEDGDFEEDEPQDIRIASEPEANRKPSRPLEPLSETNGDVGRLLEETDQKFNEDDGIRRRRVISQMRAAVAATKADRILSRIIPRDEQEAEDQNAYRQDLTRAMTRRPSFSEVTKAEEAARPAPLVLVSSQRVDEVETNPAPEPGAAPRRVAVDEDTMAEASNFREFAANMGATELPDLLEAAAAYTAFVEGQPHFSRPEIMKRVARVDPALEVSREAGLRSFGQLLRQGKIQKLQRGQFTVPASTRFNPTQRIAGE